MVRRGDQEAARRPPSIPGLSGRSGRSPALPYPPIKLSYYKTTWQNRQTKKHGKKQKKKKTPLGKKKGKSGGGGGGKPPPIIATPSSSSTLTGTDLPACGSRALGADADNCRNGSNGPTPDTGRPHWRSRRDR